MSRRGRKGGELHRVHPQSSEKERERAAQRGFASFASTPPNPMPNIWATIVHSTEALKKKSEVVKTDQRERESDTLKSPVSASREGEKRTYTLPPTFGQANNNQHSIHGTRMETSAGLRLGSHHGESTLKVHLSAKCKEDVR